MSFEGYNYIFLIVLKVANQTFIRNKYFFFNSGSKNQENSSMIVTSLWGSFTGSFFENKQQNSDIEGNFLLFIGLFDLLRIKIHLKYIIVNGGEMHLVAFGL